MTTYVPPKKNAAFITYVGLPSAGNPTIFQASATLAAGDAKVSIDGGALNNLTTLPTVTPAAGKMVKVSLSAAEMNGDNITIVMSDVAGGEWCDVIVNLQTAVNQIDDLATTVAAIKAKTDSLTFSTALRVDSQVLGMAAGTVTAAAIATDAIDNDAIAPSAVTEIQAGLATAAAATAQDAQIALIKAKTDNLPADPADASDIAAAFAAVNANLTTIDDFLDTEIAAIKAKTDGLTFTVPGSLDANIQHVNDVLVTGTGAPGTEWGPA